MGENGCRVQTVFKVDMRYMSASLCGYIFLKPTRLNNEALGITCRYNMLHGICAAMVHSLLQPQPPGQGTNFGQFRRVAAAAGLGLFFSDYDTNKLYPFSDSSHTYDD
jgi:hypothetical protein